MTIPVEQAQQLAQLLDRLAQGEELVITRGGKPVARLVPEPGTTNGSHGNGKKPDRVPGSAKGQITIAPDFDEPLEEFREYME